MQDTRWCGKDDCLTVNYYQIKYWSCIKIRTDVVSWLHLFLDRMQDYTESSWTAESCSRKGAGAQLHLSPLNQNPSACCHLDNGKHHMGAMQKSLNFSPRDQLLGWRDIYFMSLVTVTSWNETIFTPTQFVLPKSHNYMPRNSWISVSINYRLQYKIHSEMKSLSSQTTRMGEFTTIAGPLCENFLHAIERFFK